MKEIYNIIVSPQILILIGGLLTLIGAFWSSRQDANKEKELNDKNQIIIDKTQENADLNARIVSTLTGGDSYPIVTIVNPISNDKYGTAVISLKGEIPLTNVNGKMLDIREVRKEQKEGIFMSNKHSYKFDRRIISPAYVTSLNDKYFDLSKGKRFLVHFYTPYHTFRQRIAVELTEEGKSRQAYQIFKDEELIHTEYPEDFPIPLEDIDFLEPLTDKQHKKALKIQNKENNKRKK